MEALHSFPKSHTASYRRKRGLWPFYRWADAEVAEIKVGVDKAKHIVIKAKYAAPTPAFQYAMQARSDPACLNVAVFRLRETARS